MTNEELAQLYARYGYLVHRRCLSILGSAADANDALQDTFLRVRRYPPVGVASMLGWLQGVATRVCFDQLQRTKRDTQRPRRGDTAEASGSPELALSLGQALLALDDTTREMAVLHLLEGLTHEEVAERTGYSRKTVGVKLKAAETHLRIVMAAAS